MKNENRDGLLKTLFTVIGALVSICAVIALAYVLFKKFFQVTFECDEGDGGLAEEGTQGEALDEALEGAPADQPAAETDQPAAGE